MILWNGPLLVNNTVWVTTKYKAVHLERRLAEPGNHLTVGLEIIFLRTKGYGVILFPFGGLWHRGNNNKSVIFRMDKNDFAQNNKTAHGLTLKKELK